uniref:Retrovirus-related Pol polyprotein from transposon TNT 1-94 n=1 Tax=Tanacetum cinerariifolium TaxID=118510 RepID=A0A699H8V6_TANCI|nr:hypothetical protein [Tanacetum cinerariifolium]
MGTFRETLAEGEEGAPHLGLERARVYSDFHIKIRRVRLNRGFKESNYDKLYAYLKQHEENSVVFDEKQLLFIAGGQENAIDEDVDEPPAPTAQTIFMANLSSTDPVYDEAGSSYDSDILSEYDQYVKDNAEPVVQNNVSSIPNNASMMIINEMHEQTTQCVSVKAHTEVVEASLTAKLAIYREQIELFTEMHDAHTVVQVRCLELEAALSKLNDKIQKDDHNELVKHFSNLENNREVHLDYLKHLKENVATLREILEEARAERPLDRSLASACLYTKHS